MGTYGSAGVEGEKEETEKEGYEERNAWKNSPRLSSDLVIPCPALTSCFKGESAMLIQESSAIV